MARNHKFFFDKDGTPRARGPSAERVLMTFLEVDVQGSDHVCHDLMDDLVAIEDGSDDQREFVGNAHRVSIDREGVLIEPLATPAASAGTGDGTGAETSGAGGEAADAEAGYRTGSKHFREVLEDWEAFILNDDLADDALLDDDFA